MLISNQTVTAHSFVIPLALGQVECPVATLDIPLGVCMFSNFIDEVDEDSVFDLCDLIAGVVADTYGDFDGDDGLEDWELDIYLFEHREVLEGYMCELLVTKTNEVCFYIDGDADRIPDMDPRKGSKIIRKMVTVFEQFVDDHPGKTLYACPHVLDGSGEDRFRFFKRLGFAPDLDDDGYTLFYNT